MFTGIISDQGSVISLEQHENGAVLRVHAGTFVDDSLVVGESIANNGVCLTVVSFDPQNKIIQYDVGSETLRCTTLGNWQIGTPVNIERAMRASDRLGGHFVQGHVDCVSEISSIEQQGETYRLEFSLPAELAKFVAAKGSICVDGISFTIGETSDNSFSVYIIPHTWNSTACKHYVIGSAVNLEVDCLARYVARALECHSS